MKNDMSRLTDIENGARVRIASFDGAPSHLSRLNRYGLYPGDYARVLRQAPFGGPILLEVRGMEIALGRKLAELILVELVACDSH